MINPFYTDEFYTHYAMDCEIGMKELPENSIDLIVTDPPYGYSFMGKDWDKAVPSVSKWHECLRVLKPGAFAFIMSAPRQDVLSRMIVNLQDAGFETGFTSIYWTYASGFPKAMNIGKAVDKQLGVEREVIDTIKKKPSASSDCNEGWVRPWAEGKTTMDITKASTPEAKALDGSYGGFQPKPAVEVIIVCMKPLSEKTYVAQALENGKGITWLDNCRIPFVQNENAYENGIKRAEAPRNDIRGGNFHVGEHDNQVVASGMSQLGRFPANLLVSDDVLNDGIERTSGKINGVYSKDADVYGEYKPTLVTGIGDSGSFSRFFDLDKWWESKVKDLPQSVQDTFPFLICPKASKGEKNIGCEGLEDKQPAFGNDVGDGLGRGISHTRQDWLRKNNHPTVKPLKLMSYLVTLGSRKNDLILDPFIGSGTTARACKILGRRCIGFEIDPTQYSEIAAHRQDKVQIALSL